MTRNKNLVVLLNLLFNCIAAPQTSSLNEEYALTFFNVLTIGLCNSSLIDHFI